MKLLLIHPPSKFFGAEFFPTIISDESGVYPPMGLISIATSVLKRGKYEVELLDAAAEKFTYAQIEGYIAEKKPDAVGVTLITDYLRNGVKVLEIAKKINPEIKTIVGGHHVNLYPIETIKLKEVDYAVMGDGDLVINDILDKIAAHKSPDNLEGVITKTNYENATLKRIIVDNLDGLPVPRRDIVNYKKYKSVLAKNAPITTMLTSRGCPFNCPYCSGGNIRPRSNSTERVIEEIESCVNLRIRDILFFDELFTLNKKRVLGICNEIINRSLKIRWHARARIDCIDREMLKKMKKSGCRLLQFGIETGSDRLQHLLKRKLKIDRIREIIKTTQEEGILTYGNFMFNLPTETIDEMNQTTELATKLNLDYAVFGILSVFPKTEFYEQVLNEKKIKKDFWKLYAENPLTYDKEPALWPSKYSGRELDNVVKNAYAKFYIRPGYFLKALLRDETVYQKYIQVKSGFNVIKRFFR
jgi:radical SAM superfamily enzyme YgiQ (UPF0313 family)